MNKKIKKLWLRALRSGKYKQGKYALRDLQDNFCCLGVLCDLYHKEKGTKWKKDEDNEYFSFLKEGTALPEKVLDWAGFNSPSGMFKRKNGNMDGLAQLNDAGRSFKHLASIIEKYF